MKKRVLVIGLDGATPDLLFPWAKEGKLPNIAELINNGVSGNLRSTIPPMTAPAWTSFMTGKNPGKHGLYHFIARPTKNYEYTPVSAKDNHARTIWSILSKSNKKVGVMQVPMTYPPEKVNGFIVSGLGTPGPESEFTYPKGLKEKLLNDLKFKLQSTEIYRRSNEEKFLADLEQTERKKEVVTRHLMQGYDWDVFMVVFQTTDIVQHFFWKYMDTGHPAYDAGEARKYGNAILNCYQLMDNIIGNILKDVEEDVDDNITIIIMSDHGFGPLHKELHLNNWLMSIGLQKFDDSYASTSQHWLLKHGLSFERIAELAARVKLRGLSKLMPAGIVKKIPKHDALSCINWSETKAYSYGNLGLISINLKGRDPEGIVPEEEYEDLRDYIITELYKLKDLENGKKMVEKVFKGEELYAGPYVDLAPDLVVMTDMTYQEKATFGDFFVGPVGRIEEKDVRMRRSGQHRMNGILIMKGKGIGKNRKIENAEIIDLAPTILYKIGVAIPSDMDGKVLCDAFESDYLEQRSIEYKEIPSDEVGSEYSLSKEDEEAVKERLRKLGYIT
jgi:predicted AlkP superfamily phosphohydrolase/phosphomutase